MPSRTLCLATLLAALPLAACVETRAYLGADYERELAQPPPRAARPAPVRVVAEFRVNEELSEGATQVLAGEVKRVLDDTGVFQPADSADQVLRVSVDDRADLAEARSNGFKSGLMMGHSSGTAEDRYAIAISLEGPYGVISGAHYHPVLTTTAQREVPASFGPSHDTRDAFNIIVRNSVQRFLNGLPPPR